MVDRQSSSAERASPASASPSSPVSRWWLLAVAALAMGLVGIYQFAWSSVRSPLGARLGASETALGTVFTVYLVCQALSQFPAGWVRDRFGPRVPLLVGAPLVAVGFGWTAVAESLPAVYAAFAVGGVGAGVVYTVAINTAVKWFDERRGLATGVVMMSYSGLSFLVIPAVRRGAESAFGTTLTALALAVGAGAVLGAVVLRDPPRMVADESDRTDEGSERTAEDATRDADITAETDDERATDRVVDRTYGWRETVRTWQFWLLYGVFVVVNGVGLMLIGKAIDYAGSFGLSSSVATASASVIAVAEAIGIVVIGGISDRFGRERTVAASLVLTGVALAATVPAGVAGAAWPFVALAGGAALFRAPAFSVFPSLVGEYYGPKHSSENYALLYSAKVPGSVFGGTVASGLVVSIGWTDSFLVAAGAIVLAGIAIAFLRPPTD